MATVFLLGAPRHQCPQFGGESSNMTPRFAAYAARHADMMYAPAQDQTNTYSSTSGITCLDTLRNPRTPGAQREVLPVSGQINIHS